MSGYGPHYSRGPVTVLPFASVARIATPTAVVLSNPGNFNACLILVSVTADPAAASVVFNFDIWNDKPGAGTYVEVLDSAAVTSVSENVYYLGAPAEVTDLATVFPPTKKIRIRPVHADTDSMTYSVSVHWFRR
jgi:hypothetical protein